MCSGQPEHVENGMNLGLECDLTLRLHDIEILKLEAEALKLKLKNVDMFWTTRTCLRRE